MTPPPAALAETRRDAMRQLTVLLAAAALLALAPAIAAGIGQPFLVATCTRFVIYAIAAVSLDLIPASAAW